MWERLQRWSGHARRRKRDADGRTVLSRRDQAAGFVCVLVSLILLGQLGRAFLNLPSNLHLQQRCRMSRMWPSYARHDPPSSFGLDAKYRLYLYRELPPGAKQAPPQGRPAIFVPGNAGSYGQVRSLASSTHHLFRQGEGVDASEIDWWAVDFNEDFSAFHGETLHEQSLYLNDVITYLRTIYSNDTKPTVLSHSMGGIAARLMLTKHNHPHNSVETIITFSSPHAYPPVPVDSGLDEVYATIESAERQENGPSSNVLLVSLSGGILDDQLSSEGSVLGLARLWRKETSLHAFTSSLAALWSGVDHLAMMWCDQLRERVARGVLRIEGQAVDLPRRREQWRRMLGIERFSDLHRSVLPLGHTFAETDDAASQDVVRETYKVPQSNFAYFELLTDLTIGLDVSFGSPIEQVANVRVDLCSTSSQCRHVAPEAYDIVPPSKSQSRDELLDPFPSFPIASHRYELPGAAWRRLVISQAELKALDVQSIRVERAVSARGFSSARFAPEALEQSFPYRPTDSQSRLSKADLQPHEIIVSDVDYTLLAYSFELDWSEDACTGSKMTPMLRVQSLSTGDVQFYPAVQANKSYRLMLHGVSPFMPLPPSSTDTEMRNAFKFTLLSDDCTSFRSVRLSIEPLTSVGLLLSRYRTALVALPLSILLLVSSMIWEQWDHGAPFPDTLAALVSHMHIALPTVIAVGWAAILVQKFAFVYLADKTPSWVNTLAFGMPSFSLTYNAILSTLFFVSAYGLLIVLAVVIQLLVGSLSFLARKMLPIQERDHSPISGHSTQFSHKTGLIAIAFLVLLGIAIYTLIPIQFVFLVVVLIQLFASVRSTALSSVSGQTDACHQQRLLLNILIWHLPLNAPILLVWSRNLLNKWYGTLGTADHNAFRIVGFLCVTYISSGDDLVPRAGSRLARTITSLLFLRGALLGNVFGIRFTYSMFGPIDIAFLWLASIYVRAKFARPEETHHNVIDQIDSDIDVDEKRQEASVDDQLRFSNVPASAFGAHDDATIVPPSILQSLKEKKQDASSSVDGYTISSGDDLAETRSKLDVLLEEYLTTLNIYLVKRHTLSDTVTQGVFQLSRARMQLGLPYMSQSWDARMKATMRVDDTLSLCKVVAPSESTADQTPDAKDVPATLRNRKNNKKEASGKDEAEKEGKEAKEKEKGGKEAAPYDPLYQFAALPPPTLRNAQSNFRQALTLAIGDSQDKASMGLLAIVKRLADLEAEIRAEKTKRGTPSDGLA